MSANQLEISNNDYQTSLFEGREGYSMAEYRFRTFKELAIKLSATAISDLACVYFFYTALETSLFDFISLKWDDYHKLSMGDLLIMQYEKAQAMPKFIYEFFISLTSCIFQIVILTISITNKTSKGIGTALTFSGFAHVIMFFLFFNAYNKLQTNFLQSKSKTRAIVNEEAENFSIIKTYNLENTSVKKVDSGLENRRFSKMKYAVYDAKTGLIYKSFEIFSISIVYIFYYLDRFSGSELNVVTKQIVLLYEAMRSLLKALGDLRNEFHVFYKLEEYISSSTSKSNGQTREVSTKLIEKTNSKIQSTCAIETSTENSTSSLIEDLTLETLENTSDDCIENAEIPLVLNNGKIFNFSVLNCADLSFQNVFSHLTFRVNTNEKIAVVGCNGSGKTSLLRMIVGLYDSNGKISFNSVKSENIDPKILKNLITFISQNDAYTLGSVMKNLQYGNTLSRDEIVTKCKLFNTHSTFASLKNGYDTVSNSLGTEFSGGQKQKISFMRGVLRDLPVLVIDDCLNGVTTVDRMFLTHKILSSSDKTIVMTCDRFENLRLFDKIIVLDSMNCKFGTFKELENDLKVHFGKI